MAIEQSIVDLLGPLVGGRIHADSAEGPPPRPYIVFQQVGGRPMVYLESTVPDLQNGRWQINVWANDRPTASSL